jgi:hypothetical protein
MDCNGCKNWIDVHCARSAVQDAIDIIKKESELKVSEMNVFEKLSVAEKILRWLEGQ